MSKGFARNDTAAGSLPEPLEDAWADFARSLARRRRSPATAEVYRKSFEQFWTWATAEGRPSDPSAIGPGDLNAWLDHLGETPVVRAGKVVTDLDPRTGQPVARHLTGETIRIRWRNLRPFFAWWAVEMDCPNPAARADSPGAGEPPAPDVLLLDDVRALLATCGGRDFIDRRDTALIRLLFDTGARLGEIVSMEVRSWDRRSDLLTLTGKTGIRVVPTSPSTGEALTRYLRVRAQHPRAALGAFWLAPRGALGPSGVAQVLNRRSDLAGIARVNPHRFRHTWAHAFRAEGGSEGDLMYLAGWKSTTMAHRYGRSAAAERARAAHRRIAPGDLL